MKKKLTLLITILIVLSLYELTAQERTVVFSEAFNLNDLNKVEIDIPLTNWRNSLLTSDFAIDANVSVNGNAVLPVSLSRKGNTSKYNTEDRDKIPFNVDGPDGFNFKLNNNYRDYSAGAREYIGYKLHQAYSGIGSDTAPTEVYVNGEFYGLYLAVEDLNKRFYDKHLEGISQRMKANPTEIEVYDQKPYSNLFWLGSNSSHYEGRYEIKTGSIDELINLIDIINNNPSEAYEHIDIEQVCRFLAVENYLMNVDGIMGEVYSHNYELVKRSRDSKWQLVPWDLNLILGAWSNPSVPKDANTLEVLTQLPLTFGTSNNALVALIMEEYFFLYHYHYRQLLKQVNENQVISWANEYRQMIEKSNQNDDKLYNSNLYKRAYTEDLKTSDGYATGLIPTIKSRSAFLKSLSLDQKFSNKITQVEQFRDSVFTSVTSELDNEPVIIEYLNAENEWKRLRSIPLSGRKNSYYAVLPKGAKSYFAYSVYKGVRYSYPYNGKLNPIEADFSDKNRY